MATARVVRVFMFTDIVDSTRLAETLGDEAWDGVTRVARPDCSDAAVAEQGGEEVKATGDGFFLAFADADQAIEAAIAIQRRLAEHRRATGLHAGGAHRDPPGGGEPGGPRLHRVGVNQAARIGGAADGDEILVSAATLAARHTYAESAAAPLR